MGQNPGGFRNQFTGETEATSDPMQPNAEDSLPSLSNQPTQAADNLVENGAVIQGTEQTLPGLGDAAPANNGSGNQEVDTILQKMVSGQKLSDKEEDSLIKGDNRRALETVLGTTLPETKSAARRFVRDLEAKAQAGVADNNEHAEANLPGLQEPLDQQEIPGYTETEMSTGGAENGYAGAERVPGMDENALPFGQRNGFADGERGETAGGNQVLRGFLSPDENLNQAVANTGATPLELRDTTSDPQLFSSSLEAARQDNPHGLMVSGKSVEELSQPGTVTFMSPDNMAGALVTADGDIEAVFKNPKSAAKGARSSLLLNAINNGGTKLDCYGQGLVTTLYDLAGAVGKEEVVGLQPTSSSIKKLYEAYQERGAAGAVSYAVATSQIVPTGKVSEITGEKGTTNEDFYRAYFGTSESVQNQAQNYLTKVNDEKGNEVYRQFGAAAVKEWVRYKTTVDLDKNGGITQTEAEVWLKHSNLTQAQKAWFWKNTNKRWEDRSNPFI